MWNFKRDIFRTELSDNSLFITSLVATSYLETTTYFINVNLTLNEAVAQDTIFEIQVDSGMLSNITILTGNNIGSDNINTGSSSYGAGILPACILTCDNPNVDITPFICGESNLEQGNISSLSESSPVNGCSLVLDSVCYIDTVTNGAITSGDIVYDEFNNPIIGGNQYYKIALMSTYIVLISDGGVMNVDTICA